MRVRLLVVLLAAVTGACGPSVDVEGFVKREKVDIVLGDRAPKPPAVPRPAGANPVHTGFPSFIAPPPPGAGFPVDGGPGGGGAPPPGPPPPACRTAPANAFPVDTAGSTIDVPPKEGVYQYRREGRALSGGVEVALPAMAERRVFGVEERSQPAGAVVRRFSVEQAEGGVQQPAAEKARTTTVYEADPTSPTRPTGIGVTPEEAFAGFKIAAVTTESPAGSDAFRPASPVRIATMPFVVEGGYWGDEPDDRSEQGADPLTGARMAVQHKTLARVSVDVCGTLHQAWRVAVQGEFSSFGGTSVFFVSKVEIAPQLGGIVLRDELVLSDATPSDENADGEWELQKGTDVWMTSVSTAMSTTPRAG